MWSSECVWSSEYVQVVHSDGVHAQAVFQSRLVDLDGLSQGQGSPLSGLDDGNGLPKLITHDGGGTLSLPEEEVEKYTINKHAKR